MRSDDEIQRDVLDELEFDPAIDASNICVAARDGVVSLSGHVPGYTHKYLAECAAKRVYGVRSVGDEIQVGLPRAGERPDTAIAEAALCRLRGDSTVPADRIQITVDEGRITLEGVVEGAHERAAAERAVRDLTGIRAVQNLIAVLPTVKVLPAEVRQAIADAFRRIAALDARRIHVDADDERVVLRGKFDRERRPMQRVKPRPRCPAWPGWRITFR
jgi:osmotically-inducible protein OsmY